MVKFGALVSLAFAAAMLAGCSSGSQNQLPLGSSATVQSPMTMGADSCLSKGGVRVTPCKVVLTASQPGPDTVTLRTPHGSKGSVVEHDTCGGASGKATITQLVDRHVASDRRCRSRRLPCEVQLLQQRPAGRLGRAQNPKHDLSYVIEDVAGDGGELRQEVLLGELPRRRLNAARMDGGLKRVVVCLDLIGIRRRVCSDRAIENVAFS